MSYDAIFEDREVRILLNSHCDYPENVETIVKYRKEFRDRETSTRLNHYVDDIRPVEFLMEYMEVLENQMD